MQKQELNALIANAVQLALKSNPNVNIAEMLKHGPITIGLLANSTVPAAAAQGVTEEMVHLNAASLHPFRLIGLVVNNAAELANANQAINQTLGAKALKPDTFK